LTCWLNSHISPEVSTSRGIAIVSITIPLSFWLCGELDVWRDTRWPFQCFGHLKPPENAQQPVNQSCIVSGALLARESRGCCSRLSSCGSGLCSSRMDGPVGIGSAGSMGDMVRGRTCSGVKSEFSPKLHVCLASWRDIHSHLAFLNYMSHL
jgi:hypothetical protein